MSEIHHKPPAGLEAELTLDDARRFDGKAFVATLTTKPGVYRMLNKKAEVIYVGKARNLKSRVASYFRADNLSPKVAAMVPHICGIEITITQSDTEALLLEYNLIKQLKPHYNVLLKDGRTFPYIHLTDEPVSRMMFYRGARTSAGRFFGPYPNSLAVRDTLNQIQKLFKLRSCEPSVFENRTRACLQHQIKRCSAPCVGMISPADYQADVASAVKVLEGRNDEVADKLAALMESHAQALEFEKAALVRDQLAALKQLQARQIVSGDIRLEADVIATHQQSGVMAVSVMFIRAGRNLGTTTYFLNAHHAEESVTVMDFLTPYYMEHTPPSLIICESMHEELESLSAVLSKRYDHAITFEVPKRGIKHQWVHMGQENAQAALTQKLVSRQNLAAQFKQLTQALSLTQTPQRIECFDISHSGGELTTASCVVFGREGAIKSEYRRFKIDGIEPGDDYAAMHAVLTRRFKRILKGESPMPDVLLIDGGLGQIEKVHQALVELSVEGPLIVGISKGVERRPGMERLHLYGADEPLILGADSKALHLLQRIRDEAHRFAIAGHRARRAKARQSSVLEDIPGLGAHRRRLLLKQFGGLQGILGAGVNDLALVKGISHRLAELIYERLHPNG
jgi:excinuclease ABC subunit C